MRKHSPYRQATLLQQALSSNKMRIAFLLGAGCPVSIRIPNPQGDLGPLIPDIAGLTSLVKEALLSDEAYKVSYQILLARFDVNASPNIEEILSHLRALLDVVRNGSIDGLDRKAMQL